MEKLTFILPDDKYADWLCKDIQWKVDDETLLKDPVIQATVSFSSTPRFRENEYTPLLSAYGTGGYCIQPESINPTGHINLTRAPYLTIVLPIDVQILALWITFVDPNDETILEKVQLIQLVLKNE